MVKTLLGSILRRCGQYSGWFIIVLVIGLVSFSAYVFNPVTVASTQEVRANTKNQPYQEVKTSQVSSVSSPILAVPTPPPTTIIKNNSKKNDSSLTSVLTDDTKVTATVDSQVPMDNFDRPDLCKNGAVLRAQNKDDGLATIIGNFDRDHLGKTHSVSVAYWLDDKDKIDSFVFRMVPFTYASTSGGTNPAIDQLASSPSYEVKIDLNTMTAPGGTVHLTKNAIQDGAFYVLDFTPNELLYNTLASDFPEHGGALGIWVPITDNNIFGQFRPCVMPYKTWMATFRYQHMSYNAEDGTLDLGTGHYDYGLGLSYVYDYSSAIDQWYQTPAVYPQNNGQVYFSLADGFARMTNGMQFDFQVDDQTANKLMPPTTAKIAATDATSQLAVYVYGLKNGAYINIPQGKENLLTAIKDIKAGNDSMNFFVPLENADYLNHKINFNLVHVTDNVNYVSVKVEFKNLLQDYLYNGLKNYGEEGGVVLMGAKLQGKAPDSTTFSANYVDLPLTWFQTDDLPIQHMTYTCGNDTTSKTDGFNWGFNTCTLEGLGDRVSIKFQSF